MRSSVRLIGFPVLSLLLLFGGCSHSPSSTNEDICKSKSKCSADVVDPTKIAECEAASADVTCGSAYRAESSCALANIKCGSDGKTDLQASAEAVAMSCESELLAYENCLVGEQDGGTHD